MRVARCAGLIMRSKSEFLRTAQRSALDAIRRRLRKAGLFSRDRDVASQPSDIFRAFAPPAAQTLFFAFLAPLGPISRFARRAPSAHLASDVSRSARICERSLLASRRRIVPFLANASYSASSRGSSLSSRMRFFFAGSRRIFCFFNERAFAESRTIHFYGSMERRRNFFANVARNLRVSLEKCAIASRGICVGF